MNSSYKRKGRGRRNRKKNEKNRKKKLKRGKRYDELWNIRWWERWCGLLITTTARSIRRQQRNASTRPISPSIRSIRSVHPSRFPSNVSSQTYFYYPPLLAAAAATTTNRYCYCFYFCFCWMHATLHFPIGYLLSSIYSTCILDLDRSVRRGVYVCVVYLYICVQASRSAYIYAHEYIIYMYACTCKCVHIHG